MWSFFLRITLIEGVGQSLRIERLKKSTDFQKVFDARRSFPGRLIVLHAVENGLEYCRVGFTAGKKSFGNAVNRNRGKRRLKECFRQQKISPNIGYDIIVVGRSAMIDADYQELYVSMRKVLKKSGVISSSNDEKK